MKTASRPAARAVLGAAITGLLLLGSTHPASAGTAAATQSAAPAVATSTLAAYTYTAADVRMRSALTSRATSARFGTSFTGAVVDAASNTVVWRKNGDTALMPASTAKLVTAANALTVFGPAKRFTTTVRATTSVNQVIVVGSGDPSLSSAQLDAMARTTAAHLAARGVKSARVWIDDDVFPTPTLATGWKSSYVPDSITPVRGLVRDQRDLTDTSADVGRYVRDRLTAYGIPTVYYSGRKNAVSGSAVIASSRGATLSTSVSRMLLNSDNEIAEAVHKLVGIAKGTGATWSGARTAQTRVLSQQGLTATALYDGSGLSRADRLSALQLARIVDRGLDPTLQDKLWPMQSAAAIPTAGRTGTLKYRFTTTQSKCAVGRLWAKTGRLSDVVSLAGFTKGTDGRLKAFAFVVNGKESSTTLKQSIDMLAATVNGCY
jgi:D-alanyl-D-alanine carboxypeptidase/D-alanyl-D-alanine-endopeptidase (penicillin-binding protein 4)